MGGPSHLPGDVAHGGFGGERVIVVVVHGTGHPEDARHQHTEAAQQLGVVLEHPAVLPSAGVEGEALRAGLHGSVGGLAQSAQFAGVHEESLELRVIRGLHEARCQAVQDGGTLTQQPADGDVGGKQEHGRDDGGVHHESDDRSDDGLEHPVERVRGSLCPDGEHQHGADRDLVRRPWAEAQQPGDQQ